MSEKFWENHDIIKIFLYCQVWSHLNRNMGWIVPFSPWNKRVAYTDLWPFFHIELDLDGGYWHSVHQFLHEGIFLFHENTS